MGALISDELTGCMHRAVAQEEEKRCNGRTSCLKVRAKREGRGRERREITEGREVIQSGEMERAG